MPLFWIVLIIFAIAGIGFIAGRQRALKRVAHDSKALHSLPAYYGAHVGMWAIVPAFGVLVIWLLAQPILINARVLDRLPADAVAEGSSVGLLMSDVRRVAEGLDVAVRQGVLTPAEATALDTEITDVRAMLSGVGVALGSDIGPEVLRAAQHYRSLTAFGYTGMTILVVILALAGAAYALSRTKPAFRARNVVERGVLGILMVAASIAVLTTVGIFFALLFNTIEFFRLYPAAEFFFGLNWAPSFSGRGGASDLGMLPLLWGTLYISLIALLVAVPIGLFSAIYLSEYASPLVRSVAKPLIEVLAGIPTIVYGLFALLTVGPLLVSVFGNDTLGWMSGGTAVMTEGLVMGIMLIPFVSSLSDDIINAVP